VAAVGAGKSHELLGHHAATTAGKEGLEGPKGDKAGKGDNAEEGKPTNVPFSRLLAMNRPEWGWGIMGALPC
jgi:hypothetical protein